MEEYIFRIGKWYFESTNRGVQYTTNINEAETFMEIQDINNLIESEVYSWIKEELEEKMEEMQEPIAIEIIIKF